MVQPTIFTQQGGQAIASYNYTDLAEGTGVVIYYGLTNKDNAATNYMLSSQAIKSSSNSTNIITAGTNVNCNFDLTSFNIPKEIKGTAYYFGGICGYSGMTGYITVQIQKVSGGVESNCSSVIQSETFTMGAGEGGGQFCLMAIPLTQTHFKKGDTLRLNVIFYKTGGGSAMGFTHSPTNMDTGQAYPSLYPNVTTQLKLYIPFAIGD